MKNIRVLQILNRLNVGGVSTVVLNLCQTNLLAKTNFTTEVSLLTATSEATEGSAIEQANTLGISPIFVPDMQRSINYGKDKKAYNFIKKYIQKYQPNVVHTHAAKAGALGRLAAYNTAVPAIVHTFHGHVFEGYFGRLKSNLYINIERYLARKTDKIIAISDSQKNDLSQKFKIAQAAKFEVIHNGFELSSFSEKSISIRKNFRKKWNIADNEVAIGIIGRLVPIKNVSFFIDAFKLLSDRSATPIKAIIIGDGEEKTMLQEKVKRLQLSNKVVFTSWINPIFEAYAGIDVLALTSKNEGTPTTLIEAQAAAVPIVSTNVGGIKDIVIANKSAFLVDKTDINGFADCLQKQVESSNLRESMGEVGQTFALNNFTLQQMNQKTYELYSRILQSKKL